MLPTWGPRRNRRPAYTAGASAPRRANFLLKPTLLGVIALLLLCVVAWHSHASGHASALVAAVANGGTWAVRHGAWGEGALALLVALLLLVPLMPCTMVGVGLGAALPFGTAMLVFTVGRHIGTVGAFVIARFLLRARLEAVIQEKAPWRAMATACAKEQWKITFLRCASFPHPFLWLDAGLCTRSAWTPLPLESKPRHLPGCQNEPQQSQLISINALLCCVRAQPVLATAYSGQELWLWGLASVLQLLFLVLPLRRHAALIQRDLHRRDGQPLGVSD